MEQAPQQKIDNSPVAKESGPSMRYYVQPALMRYWAKEYKNLPTDSHEARNDLTKLWLLGDKDSARAEDQMSMAIKFGNYIDDPTAEKPKMTVDIENTEYLEELLQLVLKHSPKQVH